jgi:hypothetical protein
MRISISSAATPATSSKKSLPRFREIVELLAAVGIKDYSSNRNREYGVFAQFTMAVRAFAVASALGAKFAIVTVAQQCVVVWICFQPNASAIPTIASRWAAPRDILLPAERDAAIAAVPGLHQNFGFICKHGSLDQREIS